MAKLYRKIIIIIVVVATITVLCNMLLDRSAQEARDAIARQRVLAGARACRARGGGGLAGLGT